MIHAVELTIRNKLPIHFQPADVVGLQAGFGLLAGGQLPEELFFPDGPEIAVIVRPGSGKAAQ